MTNKTNNFVSKLYPVADLNLDDYLINATQVDGEILTVDGEEVKYLNVDGKILWFRKVYPHGCILTERTTRDDGAIEFVAKVFMDVDASKLPIGVGHAEGFRTEEQYKPYESVESVAIGRALNVAGFGTEQKIKVVKQTMKDPEGYPYGDFEGMAIKTKEEPEEPIEYGDDGPAIAMKDPASVLDKKPSQVDDEDVEVIDPLTALGAKPSAAEAKADAAEKEEGEIPSEQAPEPVEESANNDNSADEKPKDTAEEKPKRGRKPKKADAESEDEEPVEEKPKRGRPSKKAAVEAEEPPVETSTEQPSEPATEASDEPSVTEADNDIDFVITESDGFDTSLIPFIGHKVSEIPKEKMVTMAKYLKDELSARLYNALCAHINNG